MIALYEDSWESHRMNYEKSLKANEDTWKLLSSRFGPFHRMIGAAYHNIDVLQMSYIYVGPKASVA